MVQLNKAYQRALAMSVVWLYHASTKGTEATGQGFFTSTLSMASSTRATTY